MVLRLPLQLPEATQLSASLEPQIKVADWPCSMLADDTDRLTTGTGGGTVTFTVTLSLALPPSPLQVRLYVAVEAGLTLCVPEVLRLPPQLPEALQLLALLALQLNVAD